MSRRPPPTARAPPSPGGGHRPALLIVIGGAFHLTPDKYPFANYLQRIRRTCEAVGAHRVMWATDWPWFDWAFKYEQGLNAIRRHAPWLREDDKALFLGGTAVEFMSTRLHDQVRPDAVP